MWLIGGLCQVLGWILLAVALAHGSLVVVQSLCALSLVFAVPLGAHLTVQHIGRRSIVGVCSALVGIVAFVVVGQPQGGITSPGANAWWVAGLISAAAMVVLAGFALQQSALRTGFLAPAMAASNATTLVTSVVLG